MRWQKFPDLQVSCPRYGAATLGSIAPIPGILLLKPQVDEPQRRVDSFQADR
jgi:hypothetical protein